MLRTGKELERPTSSRLTPLESNIGQPERYSRLVLVRKIKGQPQVLVQKLDNGLVVFPGGQEKDTDGDPIETIVRECGEEGTLNRGQLRTLRNYDLLYGSFVFQVAWKKQMLPCIDTCHLILAIDDIYGGLQQTQDGEIISTAWVNLQELANGSVNFEGEVPQNVQEAASKTIPFLPKLTKAYE